MKNILSLIFIIALSIRGYSATITETAGGGEWTTGATWIGGSAPVDGDVVVILAGSTVTITDNFGLAFNGTISVSGTLSLVCTGFVPAVLTMDAASAISILSGGQITSGGGGTLQGFNSINIGTNAPAYNHIADGATVSGPATVDEAGGVLPIELLYFEAKLNSNTVIINWATTSEENFDYFTLERSSDGSSFQAITTIKGTNESSTLNEYSFVDAYPLLGTSYYRLVATDLDGTFETFDVVGINCEGEFSSAVFPNPSRSSDVMVHLNDMSEYSFFSLHNIQGDKVFGYCPILCVWA